MRYVLRAAALMTAAVLLPATLSNPVAAFGDQCHRDIKAAGATGRTMSAARANAIGAWEAAVAKHHGNRYANWYYSTDRTFECSWDSSTRIRCVAIAGPCGRKR